jgi:hypothetical protein
VALLELQGVLARLYVDGAFRAAFFARPAAAPLPAGLTAADRRLLAGLDRSQVERFARSLRAKRSDRIRRLLPAVGRLLGDRFPALFADYAAANPVPPPGAWRDALGFLDSLGAADLDGPAYLADLVACERLCLRAVHDVVADEAPAVPRVSPLARDARPRLAPRVSLGRFGYDVARLYALAVRGEPIDPQPDPSVVLVGNLAGEGRVRLKRISPFTADLVARCDGVRTVAAIAAALTPWLGGELDAAGRSALEPECLARLTPLVASGFLRLASEAAPPTGGGVLHPPAGS